MNEWKLENSLDAMCGAGAYRPMRLHALVLEEHNQTRVRTGAVTGRGRALAMTGEGPCLEFVVETSNRHPEVAGVLRAGSATRRLIPTGATSGFGDGGPPSGRNRG